MLLDRSNILLRCGPCHGRKTAKAKAMQVEKAARRGLFNASAEHFQNVLGGPEGIDQADQIGGRWGS